MHPHPALSSTRLALPEQHTLMADQKPLFWAFWSLTLIGGLITVGGLGSLTSQLGVNRTKPFDFRLDWFYWSLEVFALLWIGAGVLLGKYHAFKLAFVGIAAYVNLALTPVIQTVLDLPSAANIDATAAGLLIVTIFNFLLIIQTAFFDDSPAQPAFATDKV